MDLSTIAVMYAMSAAINLISFYLTVVVIWCIYEASNSPDKHWLRRLLCAIGWPFVVVGYFRTRKNDA